MKKIIGLLIVVLSFVLISANALAAPQIKVVIGNKSIELSTPAIVENGTTLVPLRNIFEALNVTPKWNGETQEITAEKNGVKIWLQVNNKKAKIGQKEVVLNRSPKVCNGSTLVPIRFISEAFGSSIEWDKDTRTIFIDKQELPVIIDEGNIKDYLNLTYEEVKQKYGVPTYEGYYNGGRLLVYNYLDLGFLFGEIKESYLNDKVMGLMVSKDTYIYKLKGGMSIKEVKQILGTPITEEKDESGEGYDWYLYYRVGNYDIWINSDGPESPIELITLINKPY